MNGIGAATLAKFREIERLGGWIAAADYWQGFGYRGNRLPWLVSRGFVESFGFNFLSDRDEPLVVPSQFSPLGREPVVMARVGYRLTDKTRELLAAERGRRK